MAMTPEEARDEAIAVRTEQRCAEWTAKLQARDPRAMSDLQNMILDRLSADEAKQLFVTAALGQISADDSLAGLVHRYMYDECEADAMKEVEKIEAERAADFDEFDAQMVVPANGPWRHLARA